MSKTSTPFHNEKTAKNTMKNTAKNQCFGRDVILHVRPTKW